MAIKLGGGGGSASQINEVVTLNNSADTVTLSDDRVYLKGGIIETNLSIYPLASTSMNLTGSFSVGAQETSPYGAAWDGTNYWVVGQGTDAVYKYNTAGVYQSVSFSVVGQTGTPRGIIWDGTFFWVLGANGTVYKYNSAGVYQSVSWGTWNGTGPNQPVDLAWDGTHFYVCDYSTHEIFKYTSAGVFVTLYDVSGQLTNPHGITWDGTYFWVGGLTDYVYKYNSSFVYQGVRFDATAAGGSHLGIGWDGTNLLVVGNTLDKITKFTPAVGIVSVNTLGGQNYVRVA